MERARLTAVYLNMSDLELLEMARDRDSLTELASTALREELNRRDLESPKTEEPVARESDRPVILRRYRDMPPAFVDRNVLESVGIECFLQDENIIRIDWFLSNALGGIKLIVREKGAEEADKILQETTAVEFADDNPG